jgi:histidyl-tRNA synthetase
VIVSLGTHGLLSGLMKERLQLVSDLWRAGVPAEIIYRENVKVVTAFQFCEAEHIPICAILGDSEVSKGIVKLRVMSTRQEQDCPRAELGERVRALLATVALPSLAASAPAAAAAAAGNAVASAP